MHKHCSSFLQLWLAQCMLRTSVINVVVYLTVVFVLSVIGIFSIIEAFILSSKVLLCYVIISSQALISLSLKLTNFIGWFSFLLLTYNFHVSLAFKRCLRSNLRGITSKHFLVCIFCQSCCRWQGNFWTLAFLIVGKSQLTWIFVQLAKSVYACRISYWQRGESESFTSLFSHSRMVLADVFFLLFAKFVLF